MLSRRGARFLCRHIGVSSCKMTHNKFTKRWGFHSHPVPSPLKKIYLLSVYFIAELNYCTKSQRCNLFNNAIMLLGKSTGTVFSSDSVNCLMSLLVCIFWSSKSFTYKCSTRSITITWQWSDSIYSMVDALRLGFFLVGGGIFCFFSLVCWFWGVFFSPTETSPAKNLVFIIDHLKLILDHVANDE